MITSYTWGVYRLYVNCLVHAAAGAVNSTSDFMRTRVKYPLDWMIVYYLIWMFLHINVNPLVVGRVFCHKTRDQPPKGKLSERYANANISIWESTNHLEKSLCIVIFSYFSFHEENIFITNLMWTMHTHFYDLWIVYVGKECCPTNAKDKKFIFVKSKVFIVVLLKWNPEDKV